MSVKKQAFIAKGQHLSQAIDVSGLDLTGIEMPSRITGAALTFQASDAMDGTFNDLYDETGTEVSVTVAANRAVTNVLKLKNFNALKVRTGTSGSPVAQADDAPIQLILDEEAE
jgi:hypothetical protein